MKIASFFMLGWLTVSCVHAAATPMTLVSEDEADPLRSAITRKEAWTQDAASRLRALADHRMKEGSWSVTFERPTGLALDPHDYYSEAPDWWPNPDDPGGPYVRREGRANPDRFLANRTALNNMCDAVFTLGAAAYLFDDAQYAQKATRIVQSWFINPKTRMNPQLEGAEAIRGLDTGRARGIIEGRVLIRAMQGMEFLAESGYWDARDQAAVHKWFEDYLRWLTQSRNGLLEKASADHHAAWWTAQVAAGATFVGDAATARMAFDYYRDRIVIRQTRDETPGAREESRATFWSSVFDLEALTTVCRIAEVQGVDLWSTRGKNGSIIATAIDGLQPYLSDVRKVSREQAIEGEADGLYFLATAGMGLKRPDYLTLYQKLDHPDKAWWNLLDLLVGRWEASGHQTRH